MHQIFYLTLDPEKALGIEDLIPSYHILHSEPSQLAESISYNGVDIANFPRPVDAQIYSTSKIFEDERVQKYIKEQSHGTPQVLVFKNDKHIEAIAKKLNYSLLNPSAELAKKIENKVYFSKFVESIGKFKIPEYKEFSKLSDLIYTELSNVFGSEFVIQFSYGHAGSSTFFIDSNTALDDLIDKYPLRQGKVVRKIYGVPYTVNACITEYGVVVGGISEQITGIERLTASAGGTVGNDFSQRHLDDFLRSELVTMAMEFGEILRKEGHKGIFGLDVMLDRKANSFYLIEANIRQVISCPFASYIQRDAKIVPIMLWHVLDLLGHDYTNEFLSMDEASHEWINEGLTKFKVTNDKLGYNIANNQPIQASQVFFRNINNKSVKMVDQFPAGIYRIRGRLPEESALIEDEKNYSAVYRMREDGWSTLCLIKNGYNVLQAKEEHGFLIQAMPEGAVIDELGEVGRIQFWESAFSSPEATNINGWISDVVDTVYENIRMVIV
jgi:hypothetical protein